MTSWFDPGRIRRAYSKVAETYEAEFADDLAELDFDRGVLDDAAQQMSAVDGPVLDIGCGPGQVGAHLQTHGLRSIGVDPALGMLAVARRRMPDTQFTCADMRALPVRGGGCAGVVAFYSIQYVPREHLAATVSEFRRVLQTGGVLVVAAHLGVGEYHGKDEWFGHEVELFGATFFAEDELVAAITAAGFDVVSAQRREHLAHESDTQRTYICAVAQ